MKLATASMFVAIASVCLTTGLLASPEKGLKIAIEADNRDKGFGDSTALMTTVLMDKYGQSLNGRSAIERLKAVMRVISLWLFLTVRVMCAAQHFCHIPKRQTRTINGYICQP